MERVTAVVVTYNRFELLKRCIDSLRQQTHKLNSIIVVDNGCTDGTSEWLDEQSDLDVIHQNNVGGSGGFFRGILDAHEKNNDWIWCMDDDVYPANNCLEELLRFKSQDVGIICPLRNQNGRKIVTEIKKFNLSNPLLSLHNSRLSLEEVNRFEAVEIEGISFEGPLIKDKVVESIGLPNKDLFLLYDDSDYGYRTIIAGYKILLVSKAILHKEFFYQGESRESIIRKNKWKLFYHIRNTAFFNKKHGKNIFVKYVRSFGLATKYTTIIIVNNLINDKYEWSDVSMPFKAFHDGIYGILGKRL